MFFGIFSQLPNLSIRTMARPCIGDEWFPGAPNAEITPKLNNSNRRGFTLKPTPSVRAPAQLSQMPSRLLRLAGGNISE